MNPKEFYRRWKEGMKKLTPAQILHSKLVGNWGQLIGMILAFVVLMWKGYWYFAVFMIFALFLQVVTLIDVSQQYRNLCAMLEEIEDGGNNNGS